MTDAETRAELERIDPELVKCFNRTIIKYLPDAEYITAYRLLAESQRALREIIDEVAVCDDGTYLNIACESCKKILKIAKNACKEE